MPLGQTYDFRKKSAIHLLELPEETVLHIFSFLSGEEVCEISILCKYVNTLCHENSLWKSLVEKRWEIRNPQKRNWKKYYIEKITMNKKGAMTWQSNFQTMPKIKKRNCHTASNVRVNDTDYLVFIGGQDGSIRFSEVYVYDYESRTFSELVCNGPWKPIARHTAVSDDGKIYIVGGFDGAETFHELTILDVANKTFTQPSTKGNKPQGRSNAAAALINRKLYFHGGSAPIKQNSNPQQEIYKTFGDFFCYDLETMTWTCLDTIVKGDIPAPRSGHKMITFGNKIYLFGGGVWDSVWFEKYNDTYIFDTDTLTWTKPILCGQPPNTSTFTIPFRLGNHLFIFAGAEAKKERNYVHNLTYSLDTVTMEWNTVTPEGPLPRARDMGSGNVCGDKVVFFGGYSGRAVEFYDELNIKWIPSDEP